MIKNLVITSVLLVVIILGYMLGHHFSVENSGPENGYPIIAESRDCMLSEGPCQVAGYTLEFMDRPVRPLKPIQVDLRTESELKAVVLDLEMLDMDMGINRFRLSQLEEGLWSGTIMIPVCITGRRDWRANMLVQTEQGNEKVIYSFVVQ